MQKKRMQSLPFISPHFLFTLFALPMILSLPSSAVPSCSPSDRTSLQAFQSSVSTILPWTNHTDCCLWLGVCCDSHGRIVSLHLPTSNLSGSISPHLFQLSALHSLNLSGNALYGNVAPDIANLSMLTSLDLSYNPLLIGPIPLQLPSSLHYLDISHCGLYGSIIINASSLKEVFIGDNFFSSFAWNNMASTKALQTFDAPRNFFTTGILQTLHNCTNLRLLNLDHNDVGGVIPSEIGLLSNLEIMRMQGNGIAGYIPQEMGNCKQVREIWLDENQLTGTLPEELGKLSLLTHLSLSNNRLYGSVPDAMAGCAQLLYLSLSGNMFTGNIPAGLGDLPKLEVLLIANNKFSGSMPWKIRRLGRLGTLDVGAGNRVESIISSGILDAIIYMSNGSVYSKSPLCWSACSNGSVLHIRSICNCYGRISIKAALKHWLWRFTFNIESLYFLATLNMKALQNFIPPKAQTCQGRCSLALTFSSLTVSVNRALTLLNVAHPNPPESLISWPDKFYHHRHLLQKTGDKSEGMRTLIIGVISGIGVLCGILLIAMVVALCRMQVSPWRRLRRPPKPPPPRLPSLKRFRCESRRVFDPSLTSISMRDLVKATSNFDPERVIGDGGFGLVYRATLCDGRMVAVKKLATDGIQGKREFEAELETLGYIKHRNLVELLAFCKVGDDRALVYEFMENGSLDTWLHEREDGPQLLDWKKRVRIAKGTARGLAYLHHECNPHVLHRDIKSSNILLGKDFGARIADFGLARHMNPSFSHVSTEVAGTLGYMAPEYHMTLFATKQADVYSFGMLMLELVSGKRPSSVLEEKTFRALNTWARHVVECGCEMDILDPVLLKEKAPPHDQVRGYVTIAHACVSECPQDRPTMMEAYKQLSQLAEGGRVHGENADKSIELQNGSSAAFNDAC